MISSPVARSAGNYRWMKRKYTADTHPLLSWARTQAILSGKIRGERPPRDFNGPGFEPEPTDAQPATPEKVEVMRQRYKRREQLFHPTKDAKKVDAPDTDLIHELLTATCLYFVFRPSHQQPWRVFATRNTPEPGLGDARCLYRGDNYEECLRVAMRANAEQRLKAADGRKRKGYR